MVAIGWHSMVRALAPTPFPNPSSTKPSCSLLLCRTPLLVVQLTIVVYRSLFCDIYVHSFRPHVTHSFTYDNTILNRKTIAITTDESSTPETL